MELTVDRIMDSKFLGAPPSKVRWSFDGSKIYFEWRPTGEEKEETFEVPIEGGEPRKLSKEEAKVVPPYDAKYTEDRMYALFVEDDSVYIIDMESGRRRPISETSGKAKDARFLKGDGKAYFTQNDNLFLSSLGEGSLVQVTCFEPQDEKEKDKSELQEWLVKQQKEFFETVRRAAEEEEEEKGEKPEPYYLKKAESAEEMYLSHDEKYVVFMLKEEGELAEKTAVPDYVTESGFSKEIESRLKVGDQVDVKKMGILTVETGEVRWVDHGMGERKVELKFIEWSEDGGKALVSAISLDFKDQWFMFLDVESATTTALDSQHNDAWVKRLGSDAGFLRDGGVYYLSEKDGWQHLYVIEFEGDEPMQITEGEFEVSSPRLSWDKSKLYVYSSEGDLGERHVYAFDVGTWEKTRITGEEGRYEAFFSNDDRRVALLYSYLNRPTELYVMVNRLGEEKRQLTVSSSEEFQGYDWIAPEIVEFEARDGMKVRARLYKLDDYEGRSAVVFVHGAGYMQNVHKGWSSYYKEYMFHHLLMERGYVVMDIDYRGSAGYGADWRTAIFRHMGGKDLTDQVDGVKYLVEEHGVDPDRVGVYGGSYGGFITLMALFTTPDVFKAGVALRPVTDWAHYNHSYTGRILNLPQGEEEAYRRSSPIYFADGLKNHLLICHGMVDTNVHFQDTVRLAQRLIELRKENWEVAIYPVENHGFKEETSWADEYRRILKLFEATLK